MALPTLITVHGTYLKLDGTPEQGLVQFQSKVYSLDSESDTVAVPDVVYGYLDDTGSVSITLPATNDPQWTPTGWTYLFVAQFSASFYSFEVVIPYNAPNHRISITELVPAQPGGMQLYAPYNHTHSGVIIDPATAVTAETSYGQSAAIGTDAKYARADHSHGTPALPTAGAIGAALAVHNHPQSDVTGLATTLAGKANTTHSHTESDVTGLVTDLAAKAPLASPSFTGTVSGVSKAMVGLGNADNTSDANKPVSTATANAIAALTKVLVLGPTAPVPGGTPAGTVIVRTTT